MLKTKFTFMLGSNMWSVKKVFLILLFLSGNYTLVLSQTNNIKFEEPIDELFSFITPHISHVSNTTGEEGYTFAYNYPGFFSWVGQPSIYYTNSSGDSYFGGIGNLYLISGMNMAIKSYESSKLYLNLSLGTMFREGALGTFGLSFAKKIEDKRLIEFSFDIYFHHGSMVLNKTPYLRGAMANVHYSTQLLKDLIVNFGIGLSFIQYRYMLRNYSGSNDEYKYVTWHREKHTNSLIEPKWDSHIIIPFGVTLSYHF